MQIGMVGLGRMGANMVTRLHRGGHQCVVFDREPQRAEEFAGDGITAARSYEELVAGLEAPRAVWVMVPAGEATEAVVTALSGLLQPGDTIIDGGNSYFKDDVRRAAELTTKGIHYLDVGTSGGVWGAERGYCLMIGGERSQFERLEPIFETLAPGMGEIERTPGRGDRHDTAEKGYLHCGPAGAGHFVKMAHNGVEYGQMKSFSEGFDILQGAASERLPEEYRYDLDVAAIAEVWRRGSVVVSWLLDLIAVALAEDPVLGRYSGFVEDSGEGRWIVQAAIDEEVPADVLSTALFARFRSRQDHTFADKLLSAMREKFGGHGEGGSGR